MRRFMKDTVSFNSTSNTTAMIFVSYCARKPKRALSHESAWQCFMKSVAAAIRLRLINEPEGHVFLCKPGLFREMLIRKALE